MTFGEVGVAAALSLLALFSLVVAGKAYTTAYSFHALLFAAASASPSLRSSTAIRAARQSCRR